MSRFTVVDTPLACLKVIARQSLRDGRGSFCRLFCEDELTSAGWTKPVVQINHSYTRKRGTVRGLHFQRPPKTEMKLVSCIRGEVWDVAVDIRIGSPTFLRWHAIHLSKENERAFLIPEGFAHGFQALTDDVELIYCHSAPYSSSDEGGLSVLDASLDIRWPLPVVELSSRDAGYPSVASVFEGASL